MLDNERTQENTLRSSQDAALPDEEQERPWRGVFDIEFPMTVLFTMEGTIRLDELPAWKPQPVVYRRRFDDDDDA